MQRKINSGNIVLPEQALFASSLTREYTKSERTGPNIRKDSFEQKELEELPNKKKLMWNPYQLKIIDLAHDATLQNAMSKVQEKRTVDPNLNTIFVIRFGKAPKDETIIYFNQQDSMVDKILLIFCDENKHLIIKELRKNTTEKGCENERALACEIEALDEVYLMDNHILFKVLNIIGNVNCMQYLDENFIPTDLASWRKVLVSFHRYIQSTSQKLGNDDEYKERFSALSRKIFYAIEGNVKYLNNKTSGYSQSSASVFLRSRIKRFKSTFAPMQELLSEVHMAYDTQDDTSLFAVAAITMGKLSQFFILDFIKNNLRRQMAKVLKGVSINDLQLYTRQVNSINNSKINLLIMNKNTASQLLQQDNDNLRNQLRNVTEERDGLLAASGKVVVAEKERNELRKGLNASEQKIEELEQTIEDLKNENQLTKNGLEQTIEDLKKDNQLIKNGLEQTNQRIKNELEQTKKDNQRIKNELEQTKKDNQLIKNELEQTKKDNQLKDNKIENLTELVNSINERLSQVLANQERNVTMNDGHSSKGSSHDESSSQSNGFWSNRDNKSRQKYDDSGAGTNINEDGTHKM